MAAKVKKTFEEAVLELEELSAELKSGKLGIEESIEVYNKCVMLYKRCEEILSEARQKIEIYDPDRDVTEEFNNGSQ